MIPRLPLHGPSAEAPPRLGRFIRVWGLPVHYHSRGSGQPVLLLHGNGSLGEEILSCLPDIPGFRFIAPDRPGYGLSAPLPPGHEDPLTQAAWAADLMTALGVAQAQLVAHSLAAGLALCLAGGQPARVTRLVLLAPFCRPTPHRWMPLLRLAVRPILGLPLRRMILPLLFPWLRDAILARLAAPGPVPPSLRRFPLRHAARPQALMTTAAELRRFNQGMARAAPHLHLAMPVSVLVGAADRTARPDWHLPWLRDRAERIKCVSLGHAGHLVHHAAPAVALRLIAEPLG